MLALCVKDAFETQQYPSTTGTIGCLIEAGPHVDEVGLLSSVDLRLQKPPLQGDVVTCINGITLHQRRPFPHS
jgi:hypothetical protein